MSNRSTAAHPVDVDAATGAVLIQSESLPDNTPIVEGFSYNEINYDDLFTSYLTTGFQATNLGLAIQRINEMLNWRLSQEPLPEGETEDDQPVDRSKVRATVMLGYTSNIVSSGIRESITYLVKNKMVDCIVTTCGGIEEDLMKSLMNERSSHFIGDFKLDGRQLRRKGQNRIGNLLVPNEAYCKFEDFMNPILDFMVTEQNTRNKVWSPSQMIALLGEKSIAQKAYIIGLTRTKSPYSVPL